MSYFGTKVTDPLFRKSGSQFYVCEKCGRIYTYLGIDRHRPSCKGWKPKRGKK